ncbi:MAG: ABC transporter substrate-binding protein [Nitrospirae bacterium]|nr:ABC transporter substrate-binding protein [Nitrospirota bacterium]MBF0534833.1 ABC transporter substrate-binding protein [Nitrospirota bacterium]MBF0616748.1 ABC transporter substrate-binding protein [Nitrospirota bacterium]
MKKVKLSILLIVVTLMVFTITMQTRNGKPKAVREKVSLGVALEPMTALCMIAEENGYFTANGLDMTVKYIEGGIVAIRDMLEGKIDMATATDMNFVFNSFKRQDFSAIASIGSSGNDPRIIARKDRGIVNPTDLKGKRIGTAKGTGPHYYLHLFLLKFGIPEEDVKIIFKNPADTFTSFTFGEVDAISTREPFSTKSVRFFGDNSTVFDEPLLMVKNYNIVALNSFIKNKPEVVKNTLRALVQAEEFVIMHPEQAKGIVSKKLDLSYNETSQILQDMKLKVFLEQSLLNRLEDQATWMVNYKVVENKEIPNYFWFVYTDGLNSVKPEAVTVIR